MNATPRLALPLLAAGQAQKEVLHNEALQILDIVNLAAVEEPPLSSPPASAAVGSCYLVGTNPLGEWAGHADAIAAYTSGGWRFVPPQEGATAYVRSAGVPATYRDGTWQVGDVYAARLVVAGQQVVGSPVGPIVAPAGGAVVDAEARSAIGLILNALRQHGLIET